MPSFNRVTLIGNLTRDPQVKQLPTTTVAEFGLATSRRFKASDGEDREEVCFVDCAAFGRQAETIAQYCTKGRSLFVEGRLKFDSWDDRSGAKRSKLSVVVENFQFLGSRGEGEGKSGAAAEGSASRPGAATEGASGNPDAKPERRERAARGDKAKFNQADIPF